MRPWVTQSCPELHWKETFPNLFRHFGHFCTIKKNRVTIWQTDWWMDTPSYRDGRMHRKIFLPSEKETTFSIKLAISDHFMSSYSYAITACDRDLILILWSVQGGFSHWLQFFNFKIGLKLCKRMWCNCTKYLIGISRVFKGIQAVSYHKWPTIAYK